MGWRGWVVFINDGEATLGWSQLAADSMVSKHPEQLRAALDDIDVELGHRTLTVLRSEANLTVQRQLDTLADIDDEASRILRLNVLLVGVVVSALSIASQVDSVAGEPLVGQFRNPYVELGVASLIISTALAAITYSATEYDVGVSADNVAKLLRADIPADEIEALLLKNYVARINFNRSVDVRNIPLVTATIVFALVGVVFLALGVYEATIRPTPWWLVFGACLLVGAVVLASGLPAQTVRAIRDVRAWR
mgnify:CR=1 FL=1